MQYDPKTHRLETDDGKLIKKIYCPLAKKWEQLMPWTADWNQRLAEYEAGESGEYGSDAETLQIPPLKKYCGSCQKCVLDVNSFSESQIEALVRVNPKVCIHLTSDHPELTIKESDAAESSNECGYSGVRGSKPIIQTARSVAAIEDGVRRGYRLVPPAMESSSEIGMSFSLNYSPLKGVDLGRAENLYGYQDKKNDKDAVAISFRHDSDKHPSPLAVYLVPADLEVGKSVYVADVIEDIEWGRISTEGSEGITRLKSAYAIWNGDYLEIDCSRGFALVG